MPERARALDLKLVAFNYLMTASLPRLYGSALFDVFYSDLSVNWSGLKILYNQDYIKRIEYKRKKIFIDTTQTEI